MSPDAVLPSAEMVAVWVVLVVEPPMLSVVVPAVPKSGTPLGKLKVVPTNAPPLVEASLTSTSDVATSTGSLPPPQAARPAANTTEPRTEAQMTLTLFMIDPFIDSSSRRFFEAHQPRVSKGYKKGDGS